MRALLTTLAGLIGLLPDSARTTNDRHPLDPLTATEITAALEILRSNGRITPDMRFPLIALAEPPKEVLLKSGAKSGVRRQAIVVAYAYASDRTFEAIVDLDDRRVASWNHVPGAEPPVMDEDHRRIAQAVRADPRWRLAISERGYNPDSVRVSAYPIGPFGPAGAAPGRLAIARSAGVIAYGNLTTGGIEKLVVGPRENPHGNFRRFAVDTMTSPARAEGSPDPSARFTVRGNEVHWEKWRFRFGMHPREGLVLHTVGFHDGAELRAVLYRASLSELFVPYGDRGQGQLHLTAFDEGEAGLGTYGRLDMSSDDCPPGATFFPAVMHDYLGVPREVPRATCIYERDGGILWRHGTAVRRARQLVLSSVVRVDNYDYGFSWIFHLDGTLEMETLLTGLMNTRWVGWGASDALASAQRRYGTIVERGMEAMNHQHAFSYRIDLDVDGPANTIVELNTEAPPEGPENPNGNAWVVRESPLRREKDAQRPLDGARARRWKVTSASRRNEVAQATAYTLVPGENSNIHALPGSLLRRRAGFVDSDLWVTPYRADERYAAGAYVYQSQGGEGLPAWTSANRSIENTDLVLWYTLGVTHVPRPEEWPVMPAQRVGFKLVPSGFFSRNPAFDVGAPESSDD